MTASAANSVQGHGVSLITPFNETGEVDYPALERLTTSLINSKVQFIVVLGHASEAALLEEDEQIRVMDFVSEINNGVKTLVGGVACTSTRKKRMAGASASSLPALVARPICLVWSQH